MLSARLCRSVDIAAAQLIAREAGASVEFGDRGPGEVGLDLDARFPIAAGLDEEILGTLLEVQRSTELA
jgi:fructose-1,6-bisphosphatase/inositol monophosphatase family enzyme